MHFILKVYSSVTATQYSSNALHLISSSVLFFCDKHLYVLGFPAAIHVFASCFLLCRVQIT